MSLERRKDLELEDSFPFWRQENIHIEAFNSLCSNLEYSVSLHGSNTRIRNTVFLVFGFFFRHQIHVFNSIKCLSPLPGSIKCLTPLSGVNEQEPFLFLHECLLFVRERKETFMTFLILYTCFMYLLEFLSTTWWWLQRQLSGFSEEYMDASYHDGYTEAILVGRGDLPLGTSTVERDSSRDPDVCLLRWFNRSGNAGGLQLLQ